MVESSPPSAAPLADLTTAIGAQPGGVRSSTQTSNATSTTTTTSSAAATVSPSRATVENATISLHDPTNAHQARTATATGPPTAAPPRASTAQDASSSVQSPATVRHQPAFKPNISRRPSLRKRFSLTMRLTLTLGPFLIAICMGTLAFLWFSDHENPAWRYVVVNNNLVTALSGLAKVVEASLQLLVAVTCAMLAALLLEKFHVAMRDVAEVSLTRLTGDSLSLMGMFWNQLRGAGPRHWGLLLLLGFTSTSIFFSQAVTVILNTDLNLAVLRGYSTSQKLAFGFRTDGGTQPSVQLHDSFWSKSPPVFPTFAEYSQQPIQQSGVSDTGVSLRAFLPFAAQTDRQTIQSYSGRATVVDTRVTCQIPDVKAMNATYLETAYAIVLQGAVSATRHTPRLFNITSQLPDDADSSTKPILGAPVPVDCVVPVSNGSSLVPGTRLASSWRTSICQLVEDKSFRKYSGGLISEFQSLTPKSDSTDVDETSMWGVAYLVLNVTSGDPFNWRGILDGFDGKSAPFYQDRAEWRDFVFSKGDLVLSASLCYASFLTADIPVHINSTTNRTERSAKYDYSLQSYVYPEIRAQMGQNESSLNTRDLLALYPQRSSWIANSSDELPPLEPYIRNFANMAGPYARGNTGNYSASLFNQQGAATTANKTQFGASYFIPDPFFAAFFQDIVTHDGSVAFALQSMYTVIAGMAYYNQLPQFDNQATIQRTDFVTVNMATSYLGFSIVTVVILVDLLIVVVVTVWFFQKCRYSILGSAWATVAQTVSPRTGQVVDIARDMTDEEVEKWLAQRSMALDRVGIGPIKDNEIPAQAAVTAVPPYSIPAGIQSMNMRERAGHGSATWK